MMPPQPAALTFQSSILHVIRPLRTSRPSQPPSEVQQCAYLEGGACGVLKLVLPAPALSHQSIPLFCGRQPF